MKTKGMAVWIAIAMLAFPVVAMAEWGISPTMSADGRIDGAMANMSWSFGMVKPQMQGQEIVLAKNVSRQQSQISAVAKQEAESQQFFSAKEMEKLTASLQLPPPVEGRKYLKIGAKPVDPKTFDFFKEDAYILLEDVEAKLVDSSGKTSVGWLRAGEIVVTEKGKTRVIRIWRCGNPVLSELYITTPKPAKVEAAPITATAGNPTKQDKTPDLFPQATIDKIAGNGNNSQPTTGWSTKKKVLTGVVIVGVVAAAYVVGQQHSESKTTTTTTTVGPGPDPPG